jgi:AcrR family transcriptional regulator
MAPRAALQPNEIELYRERLTEVASRLFGERGYEGVTLRAIARELGCSPMTPYRYFRDKREIFAAVRGAAHARFAEAQERALASATNPLERLGALGSTYVRFALEDPRTYRLMFELDQPDPDGFPSLRDAEMRSWAPLRSAVTEVIRSGLLDGDPETVAHVFWAGVHGIVSLHLAGKLAMGQTIDDLLQPMLETLLRGNLAAEGDQA